MAELADAPDLGSGGRPCRFKSCYPHDRLQKADNMAFWGFFLFMEAEVSGKTTAATMNTSRHCFRG